MCQLRKHAHAIYRDFNVVFKMKHFQKIKNKKTKLYTQSTFTSHFTINTTGKKLSIFFMRPRFQSHKIKFQICFYPVCELVIKEQNFSKFDSFYATLNTFEKLE